MTSRTKSNRTAAGAAKWLLPHRKQFLHGLSTQGYAPATLRNYDAAIARFCEVAEICASGARELDDRQIGQIRAAVLDGVAPRKRTNTKFCLNRFIDHLVEAGIARLLAPPPKVLTALDRLREEYEAYLRNQRGLSEATIYHCLRFLERFMAFRFGVKLGDLNAITADDIVAFLCQLKVGARPYRDKTPPSHLRRLFKFLFWSGKTKRNFANSISRVAQPQSSNLPRYIRPEEVRRLIDAVRTDDPIGRRNHAMLLLMARLGLRSPEVIAIRVEDIDWRAGEIMIRGKGKLHSQQCQLCSWVVA